jgi:hypothetical protein
LGLPQTTNLVHGNKKMDEDVKVNDFARNNSFGIKEFFLN